MDNHHDIESILSESDAFCAMPTIANTLSSEEIVGFAQEHEESGTPYAITGLPLEDGGLVQSPLSRSSEWLENMYNLRGMLFISVCTVAFDQRFSNTVNNQLDAHSDGDNAHIDRKFRGHLMAARN